MPELIQGDATAERLSVAVLDGFDGIQGANLKAEFAVLHAQLALESGSIAAIAIAQAIDGESLL